MILENITNKHLHKTFENKYLLPLVSRVNPLLVLNKKKIFTHNYFDKENFFFFSRINDIIKDR